MKGTVTINPIGGDVIVKANGYSFAIAYSDEKTVKEAVNDKNSIITITNKIPVNTERYIEFRRKHFQAHLENHYTGYAGTKNNKRVGSLTLCDNGLSRVFGEIPITFYVRIRGKA